MTRTAILSILVVLSAAACGTKSPTGKPGPLGTSYDASDYYQNLSGNAADMPAKHKKNFEAVKAAMKTPARVKRTKKIRIADDGTSVTLRASWETVAVGDKQLVVSASLDAVDFSEGTSCTAAPFKRMETLEPYFDAVSVEVNCSRQDGSRHQVIGRSLYWNGSRSINEPMIPNGELTAPGQGVEISDG